MQRRKPTRPGFKASHVKGRHAAGRLKARRERAACSGAYQAPRMPLAYRGMALDKRRYNWVGGAALSSRAERRNCTIRLPRQHDKLGVVGMFAQRKVCWNRYVQILHSVQDDNETPPCHPEPVVAEGLAKRQGSVRFACRIHPDKLAFAGMHVRGNPSTGDEARPCLIRLRCAGKGGSGISLLPLRAAPCDLSESRRPVGRVLRKNRTSSEKGLPGSAGSRRSGQP